MADGTLPAVTIPENPEIERNTDATQSPATGTRTFDPRQPQHFEPASGLPISRVMGGLVDVLTGRRGVHQVADWVTPPLYQRLCSQQRYVAGPGYNDHIGPHFLVWRLHTSAPTPGVQEVWGLAGNSNETHAVAARFEHFRYGWLCTTVTLL